MWVRTQSDEIVNLSQCGVVCLEATASGTVVVALRGDRKYELTDAVERGEAESLLSMLAGKVRAAKLEKREGTRAAAVITYDDNRAKFDGITVVELNDWKEAYPAINVSEEIRAAEMWLAANPKNKKSNYRRFITNWLKKSQDKAKPQGGGSAMPKRNKHCAGGNCSLVPTVGEKGVMYCAYHFWLYKEGLAPSGVNFHNWWSDQRGSSRWPVGTPKQRIEVLVTTAPADV